jgi:hypothetical protein
MLTYLYAILIGCGISLSGSLPLGNLNMGAMYIAGRENVKQAYLYSLGVVIVELMYLCITIVAIKQVADNIQVFAWLQWGAVFFLVLLAISSFRAVAIPKMKNLAFDNNVNRLLLGMGMSTVNPMQFPFWAGWVTWLMFNHHIGVHSGDYGFFIAGVGVGTLMALSLFIVGGKYFSKQLQANNRLVNIVMGILFLCMAGYQVYKILI